ncbi:flagellar associated protein [Trypanosoma grayi]|uniref:flagellar associated protein n=1 Tax=Trypanosoma grayi TaxID=71804 RepID=UPI0004F4091E|nr:flagellar associated protein [Trypanosoma grayi]KEG14841.1 flagellar associated protein [Trypanosoma grayi]
MSQEALALLEGNPFRGNQNASTTFESGREDGLTIAEEIKRDDAMMTKELSVLSRRPESKFLSTHTVSVRGDAATCPPSRRVDRTPKTVEIKEMHSTGTFIAKKREVGLMRLALANKEAEIRHLEGEMDRVEKRLRQQQEQLASTEEKFNNFLKHSNLEQDAAVRRAEVESKAKQERLIDIKKLSAQITHVEQDMRKTEAQLELCMEYKNFMDNLTTPQWFYDVLFDIRMKDIDEVILRETEETYARRSQEVTDKAVEAQALRDSLLQRRAEALERGSFSMRRLSKVVEDVEDEELVELVPLEKQLAQLQEDLAAEAQRRQEEAAERVKQEVHALTVEEVRAVLDNDYPQERIPMFFAEPDQILDIFINVEEGNLFLIQNSQELEEELERVAMEFYHEQEEMTTMVRQRHTQMESLATRIRETQQRLSQLEERLADLESSDSPRVGGNGLTGGDGAHRRKGGANARKDADVSVMKQNVLKKLIEQAVADIFRCIHHHAAVRRPDDGDGADNPRHALLGVKKPATPQGKRPRGTTGHPAKGKKKDAGTTATVLGGEGGGGHTDGEASANMGPVEMLTIIENKVDEYHRYITNPENGVEESLIMSVIKARDKERRREARMVHLAKQSTEREERNQRALERSQAPVVRRRGKQVMWRSRPPVETVEGAEARQGSVAVKDVDQDEEFFR